MHDKPFQSFLTLCNPMDCSPPGSSVLGISRQEYWSRLPCTSPGDLPNPGIKPMSLMPPAFAGGFFTTRTSLVAQTVKCLPTMWETWVRSLGREDALEKEMAIHSNILAWKIPWTEECGRLQSMGSQRVGHNWATSLLFSLSLPLAPPGKPQNELDNTFYLQPWWLLSVSSTLSLEILLKTTFLITI